MSLSKSLVYELLEDKMLGYSDYANIDVEPNEEEYQFAHVPNISKVVVVEPIGDDQTEYTPGEILVRADVARMLHLAGQALKNFDKDLQLGVVYGYRSLEEQRRLFEAVREELSPAFDDNAALMEAAHRRIAVPSVAGHCTGGAVDVQILRNGIPEEMGTKIWDLSNRDAYTFSPFVSKTAWHNRQLLRRAMMTVGFAPFDGEWWHFSYGDKEWARFYDQPAAMYGQVEVAGLDARREALS